MLQLAGESRPVGLAGRQYVVRHAPARNGGQPHLRTDFLENPSFGKHPWQRTAPSHFRASSKLREQFGHGFGGGAAPPVLRQVQVAPELPNWETIAADGSQTGATGGATDSARAHRCISRCFPDPVGPTISTAPVGTVAASHSRPHTGSVDAAAGLALGAACVAAAAPMPGAAPGGPPRPSSSTAPGNSTAGRRGSGAASSIICSRNRFFVLGWLASSDVSCCRLWASRASMMACLIGRSSAPLRPAAVSHACLRLLATFAHMVGRV